MSVREPIMLGKMKFMQLPDTAPIAPAPPRQTVIELPATDIGDGAVREILARGNTPLLIGDTILAEIANNELSEGLAAAETLSIAELASLSTGLAESINDALLSDCATCDIAEVAADAATLFVLCLRRSRLHDVDNLPACSVTLSSESNEARLTLAG